MAQYYKTLKLTDDGDIDIASNTFSVIKNTDEELLQYIRTILNTRKGEYFLNTEIGLSHDNLIGANFNPDKLKVDLLEAIFQEERIASVDRLDISFDDTERRVYADFQATTVEGDTVEEQINVALEDTLPEDLLLDIVKGAVAAYSLKKLTNTYTGACINVIRSDEVLKNIYFENNILDINEIKSFGSDKDVYVKKMYDQSGNSFDLESLSFLNCPLIYKKKRIYEAESAPSLYFDGSNDYMQHKFVVEEQTPATVIMKYRLIGQHILQEGVFCNSDTPTASNSMQWYFSNTNTYRLAVRRDSGSQSVYNMANQLDNDFHIITLLIDTPLIFTILLDNEIFFQTTLLSNYYNLMQSIRIGTNRGTTVFSKIFLTDFLYYKRILTETELAYIHANLGGY